MEPPMSEASSPHLNRPTRSLMDVLREKWEREPSISEILDGAERSEFYDFSKPEDRARYAAKHRPIPVNQAAE